MKHASYRKTNIRRRQTKFSPHGNLEKAISAPLYQTMGKVQKPNSPNCYVHSSQLFRTDYHHLFGIHFCRFQHCTNIYDYSGCWST